MASKVAHFSLKFSKQKQKLSNPHHHPSIERKKEAKKTKINLDFILYESELLGLVVLHQFGFDLFFFSEIITFN